MSRMKSGALVLLLALPFGVYGTVAVPGRVRVGDGVLPLQDRLLAAT